MPTTSTASAEADNALPRDLADLLVELSTALHKYAMYPDGHPLLETAAAGVTRRLTPILDERATLAIAVARNQLMVDGAGSDEGSPVLRDLAMKLYRHEIGGVRIEQGVDDSELTTMLKTIARETVKGAPELKSGTHPGAALRDWPHIDLLPLSYDQLRLHDENAPADDPEKGGGWATQLWSKLARSAVGVPADGNTAVPDFLQDPLALASTIDRRENDPAFDKGILGIFGSFMEEIRAKGGSAAKGLRVRVGSLVSGMAPATLRRILSVNTDWSQRRQLVMNATNALAADTVLDLAKAASDATQHSMSEALLLLLAKLARHSDKGSAARKEKADAALRENVRQLISDWDKAAELPEENYWATMEKLIAEPGKEVRASGMYDVPPEHVVQLSLETEVFGATTRHAVSEMVRRGQIAAMLTLVDSTPDANKVVYTLRRHLDNTGTIRRLLRDRPVDFEVLYRLVSRVGFPAANALLDALEHEDDRAARWKLFEMLAQLGPKVGEAVVARLPKAAWFVQRNLLLLLGRLPEWPATFTPVPYTRAADPRVRREAFALLLPNPKTRDHTIVDAVKDTDERIVRAGLTAASENGCPRDAVPVLAARLTAGTLDGMLGVLAVRVLAPLRLGVVLECLIASTLAPKRRFQFRRKLASKNPVMLAALNVLATHWGTDPSAQRSLALAAKEPDPEIQAALRPGRVA